MEMSEEIRRSSSRPHTLIILPTMEVMLCHGMILGMIHIGIGHIAGIGVMVTVGDTTLTMLEDGIITHTTITTTLIAGLITTIMVTIIIIMVTTTMEYIVRENQLVLWLLQLAHLVAPSPLRAPCLAHQHLAPLRVQSQEVALLAQQHLQ